MKYLHTMIRIKNVDESLRFFCEGLGLKETRRMENDLKVHKKVLFDREYVKLQFQ